MKPELTFNVHDTTIHLWQEVDKPVTYAHNTPLLGFVYKEMLAFMKRHGISCTQDRRLGKHLRSLRFYNHAGRTTAEIDCHAMRGGRVAE